MSREFGCTGKCRVFFETSDFSDGFATRSKRLPIRMASDLARKIQAGKILLPARIAMRTIRSDRQSLFEPGAALRKIPNSVRPHEFPRA
jgi:hypothetical protein